MRPKPIGALFLILCVSLLAAPTGAQVGGDDGQHLTGSWRLTTTPDPPFFPAFGSLITFAREGTLVTSGAVLVPMPGGVVTFSPGHGSWKRTGARQFVFRFVVLMHDAGTGLPAGQSEVSGTITLDASGDAYSGAARAVDTDPSGQIGFAFDAVLTGTRIRPE